MKTILSADAGGTKTRVVLLDEENRVLCEALTGCGNLALDYPAAEKNITEALMGCMPEEKPEAIVVGAAGAGSGSYSEELTASLEKTFGIPVYITSDGVLAVYGALGEKDGLLVVSGTGSIIQGKKNGILHRCGGWGHLLGEYGSGANIGYGLIRTLLQSRDADRPDETLEKAVLDVLGVASVPELVAFVYSHPKADIAKLAGTADTLAAEGNPLAGALLESEAETLAHWTGELYTRLSFTSEEIRVSGGCIGNLAYFREKYRRKLHALLPDARFCPEPFDPTAGTWALHQNVRARTNL